MKITKQQKNMLIISAVIIVALYSVLTAYFGILMSKSRGEALLTHKNRMDVTQVEVKYPQPKADFTEVKVGSYVENIYDLSIAESKFSADLYIWFSWTGDKDLNPGETFQVVGGEIDSKELSSEHYLEGGKNYQRYKVSVTVSKVFDITRLSLEDHMLNIYIEDKQHDGASVNYVVDENSAISSRVKIPGFKVTNLQEVVKPHEYKSSFSSPSSNAASRVFSQYALAVSINRSDFGFYLKIFLPFLLSVSLGLTVLRLKSELIDARTGLAGAAFFGVVANAYVVSTFIPSDGGAFGILDILNFVSLSSVLLIVAVSILSHKLCIDGEETEFSKALDKTVFYSIIIGYSILSVVLPFCTYLQN